MTAQIDDTVVYQNEDFELVWDDCLEQYIHSKYNLHDYIRGQTTICYRGYVAQYEIQNAHLYLTTLHVFGMAEPYPVIDGQAPEKILHKNSRSARKRRKLGIMQDDYMDSGWVKYSSLLERIPATGYMVIGQRLKAYQYWVDFPYFFPYVYSKLLGIHLVNGQPKAVEDFSKQAAEVRRLLEEKLPSTTAEKEAVENLHQQVFKLKDTT